LQVAFAAGDPVVDQREQSFITRLFIVPARNSSEIISECGKGAVPNLRQPHCTEEPALTDITRFLRHYSISPLPVPASWFALPLRLMVGFGFIEHGYAKLARGPEAFVAILHAMGMPFAEVFGWATIAIEVVGGLLVLCGAFVPVAALPMAIVLLVAIVTVHLPNGFSSIKLMSYDAAGAHFGQPGYETDLLYLAALIALCIGGAGPLSVDGFIRRRRSS
jgi:putative oxidoreductase